MKRIFVLLLASLLFFGCSGLRRHQASGYFEEDFEARNAFRNLELEKTEFDRQIAAQQLGVSSKIQSSTSVRRRVQLNQLESFLSTNAEKAQYYHYRPLLRNDMEKIKFLSLPNMQAREEWAQLQGLQSRLENFPTQIMAAIDRNDVVMGMSQAAVKKSWGDPSNVAVAGNPLMKNEEWTYNEEIPTPDGYVSETRILYFEAGRLVGWQKKDRK